MRKLFTFCSMLLLCGSCAYSQVLLLPNQTWTYDFDSLPRTGSVSSFTSNPQGSLEFRVDGPSWQPQSVLEYEIFENSTAESPIASGTLSSTPPYTGTCISLGSWQDRQGAIRFHMVSGSATLESVTLEAIVSGPSLSSYDVYSDTFVPVPEPAIIVLLGLGLAIVSIWKVHPKVGL